MTFTPAAADTHAAARWAALSMLASAVAGRDLGVVPAGAGQPTHGTGREIALASGLDTPAQRQAVVAQALLHAAGSLRESALKRLIGRPGAAHRYMVWELARAVPAFGDRLPGAIERWLRGLTAQARPLPESAAQSVTWALERDQHARLPRLPAHLGGVRPGRLTWRRLKGDQALQQQTLNRDALQTHQGDEAEDKLANKLLKLFSSPLGGGQASSMFLKLLGFGASSSGNTDASDDNGVAAALGGEHQMTGAPQAEAEQLRARAQHTAPGAAGKAGTPPPARWHGSACYPEWFEASGRHKPGWVHIHEFVPALAASDNGPAHARANPAVNKTVNKIANKTVNVSASMIRAQIAKVGVEFQRHRAQPDGQEFDLDALIHHAVEGRHGGAVPRLYQASRRTRRDLTLLVLLDVSNSTGDRNPDGTRIVDQQREMAREITKASAQLGDQVGLYAFHSWGRHLVHFLRIKGFDETFSQHTHRRLNALEPAGMTRMGAAIRHAAHLMAKEKHHSHRVILLLSDGFAYDDQYEGRHAEADTARALSDAQAAGIGCVCLNIGSEQDDEVLKRLYGPSAYLRCADTGRAVPALRRLMRGAILSAASASDARKHRLRAA